MGVLEFFKKIRHKPQDACDESSEQLLGPDLLSDKVPHECKLDPPTPSRTSFETDINWDRLYRLQDQFDFPRQYFQLETDEISTDISPEIQSLAPKCSDLMSDYVVLDIETTGLSPKCDQIIEIGAIRSKCGTETESICTYVNPGISIPQRITELTGISNSDVADAPGIEDTLSDIISFIGDSVVIAHNAPFDIAFLCAACKKAGIDININYIDTLALARNAFPDAPNHKLSTLIAYLSLEGVQEHRALSDVRYTNQVFCKCLPILDATAFIHNMSTASSS